MAGDSINTRAASRPRNARIARKPPVFRDGVTAVVIECLDKTCTVVGSGFALSCHSITEAMAAVNDMAPRIVWRETTPGFWVARAG